MTHQKSSNKWYDATICRETIGNGPHSMFTNTITDVCTSITAQASTRWLKINGSFDFGQIAACQISRTSKKVRKARSDGCENNF